MVTDAPPPADADGLPEDSGTAGTHLALMASCLLDPPPCPGLLGALGRFHILRVAGVGGMGLVLVARDPGKEGLVAVKTVRPELRDDPAAAHRFLTEARHMAGLSHPHILPVSDVSDNPAQPFYAMPYLARGSAATLMPEGKPAACDEVLRIGIAVASALSYAHKRGLIHRDVKPSNVLLGDDGTPYLTDFGLVRTVFNDSLLDAARSHCEGTAPYMSPAVAAGEAEDTRCDIYSLGATLYHLLTGRPPYEGRTSQQVIEQIRAGPPPGIRRLNPSAPRDLVTVIEGAMARDVARRYASMDHVLRDLELVRDGKSPVGPPPGRIPARAAAQIALAALMLAVGGSLVAPFALPWVGRPRAPRPQPGTFSSGRPATEAAVGSGTIVAFVPADLDGDQDTDLVVQTAGGRGLEWRENPSDATGPWTSHRLGALCEHADALCSGDLDGDHDADIVTICRARDEMVLWRNGGGSPVAWSKQVVDLGFREATDLALGDLDGDGDLDILGTAPALGDLCWWENARGDATVWTELPIDGQFRDTAGVRLADLDGDGRMDVLACLCRGGEVACWLSPGSAASPWGRLTLRFDVEGDHLVFPADVDGNGTVDLVAVPPATGRVGWWEGPLVPGGSARGHEIGLGPPGVGRLEAVDVDADGDADVLTTDATRNRVRLWCNPGTEAGPWPSVDIPGAGLRAPCLLDRDLDGDLDLLLDLGSAGGPPAWWENPQVLWEGFDRAPEGDVPPGWDELYLGWGGIEHPDRRSARARGVSLVVSAEASFRGGRSLHCLDTSGGEGQGLSGALLRTLTPATSATLEFRMLTRTRADEAAFVYLRGEGGPDYAVAFRPTGWIGVHCSPQGWVVPELLEYRQNVWYAVARTVDCAAGTGDVQVWEVGREAEAARATIGPGSPLVTVNRLVIDTSGSLGADCFVDSIRVISGPTPQPAPSPGWSGRTGSVSTAASGLGSASRPQRP